MLKHHITDKRKALGLTQQQLADKLGWKLRKLTTYERSERLPQIPDALELAKALNTTVEELWEIEEGDN